MTFNSSLKQIQTDNLYYIFYYKHKKNKYPKMLREKKNSVFLVQEIDFISIIMAVVLMHMGTCFIIIVCAQ